MSTREGLTHVVYQSNPNGIRTMALATESAVNIHKAAKESRKLYAVRISDDHRQLSLERLAELYPDKAKQEEPVAS